MKKGTHLGTIVPVVSSIEEFFDMLNTDAEIVGKEIEKVMQVFNLRITYDREVLLMMMANISAATISALEDMDSEYAERMKELTDWHLGEYRRIKEELNNKNNN